MPSNLYTVIRDHFNQTDEEKNRRQEEDLDNLLKDMDYEDTDISYS